jgi:hypothetical protein
MAIWTKTPAAWIASRRDVDPPGLPLKVEVPPHLQLVAATLLAIDGDRVELPYGDMGDRRLARDGQVFNQRRQPAAAARPGTARERVAALWRRDRAAHTICTGYALGDDPTWRRHSWAVHRDGYLVEPTEPRRRYFGVPVTGLRAVRFALF